jgi:hypothetical protein
MYSKLNARFIFLILAIALGSVAATARADFSGYWTGTWDSFQSTATGGLQVTITQNGSSIDGSLSVFGATTCGLPIQNVPLTGFVTGDTVASFNAETNDPCSGELNRLTFTNGVLSGNTINGNYEVEYYDFGWVYWDSGTYSLDRDCCTIDATAGSGGTILPTGVVTLAPGESQAFNIAANAGYAIEDVVVNNVSKGPISTYTFSNIQSNSTITASFNQVCCTITSIAGVGGSIIPSGAISVAFGSNQTFTIAPDSGYLIDDVKIDNISQGPITSYTFTNTDSNHTITASFAKPKTLPFLPILLENE